MALEGPRRGVSRELAKINPRAVRISYDQMGILGTDGPRDDDVLFLYEDRDEHIHAETAASGQLPIRMKVEAAIESSGLCQLGHTIQLKSYDTFENDIVQDSRCDQH